MTFAELSDHATFVFLNRMPQRRCVKVGGGPKSMGMYQYEEERSPLSRGFVARDSEEVKTVPAIRVQVVSGPFAGQTGDLLDPILPVDSEGKLLPTPKAGHFWVMLTINDQPFAAYMAENAIRRVE